MLCGLPMVQQATIGDCLSFDPFAFGEDGDAAARAESANQNIRHQLPAYTKSLNGRLVGGIERSRYRGGSGEVA
jgi:hypothetical protein